MYFSKIKALLIMKKIFLLIVAASAFTSCAIDDDGGCGCTPPPGPDEKLIVKLKNFSGDNLLNPDVFGYLSNEKFTFYLITKKNTINLTQTQTNNSLIEPFVDNGNLNGFLNLAYSWYMPNDDGTKEGSYIIDYSGLYPNDTIYTKYKVTEWKDSDPIIEVKVNGVLQEPEDIEGYMKSITIVK